MEVIFKFIEPLYNGDKKFQKLDIKAFMNLFGNTNFFNYTQEAFVHSNSILYAIFDSLEEELDQYKSSLASKL